MKPTDLIAYRHYLARHDEFEKAYKFINSAAKLYPFSPELKEDAELAFKQIAHLYDPALYKAFYSKTQTENPIPLDMVFDDSTYPDRLRWVKRLLPKYNTKTVADLGCSEGSYSLNIAKAGYHVTGVNLFENSIKLAKERAEMTGLDKQTDFVQADFMEWEPKERFDAVLLFEVLEHVPNPKETVDKLINLTNPQGVVYISTPNGVADQAASALGVDLENAKGHEFKGHVRAYTEKSLRELASEYHILDFYHSETDGIPLLHMAIRRSNGKT